MSPALEIEQDFTAALDPSPGDFKLLDVASAALNGAKDQFNPLVFDCSCILD